MKHGEHLPATGATPSPNIWHHADTYEVENRAVDRRGLIPAAMARLVAEHGGTWGHVLDIGCGTGFHLPLWAERARRVTGIEPHPPLVEQARSRLASLDPALAGRIEVRPGTAQDLPVADHSIDVAHARWAYFFGPGCEPGLAELDRVMAPGGVAFVIDNDASSSTFGSWFRRAFPEYDPAAIARFWRRSGWTREPLLVAWETDTREDFEAIVRIEFTPGLADAILAEHPGTTVDYAVDLWWRTF
ncbi:class I SAM-dependent methyltransferase [Mobilicoccus sp.]|uniref:class I SAM-dependent methyltransferase n=1 Tax=Mobilicoccus sp. TaxID=2034349 RepID=UPI0028A81312|nr:class I SAM-dependent methyltransferase [Mobilicoccus sp.]